MHVPFVSFDRVAGSDCNALHLGPSTASHPVEHDASCELVRSPRVVSRATSAWFLWSDDRVDARWPVQSGLKWFRQQRLPTATRWSPPARTYMVNFCAPYCGARGTQNWATVHSSPKSKQGSGPGRGSPNAYNIHTTRYRSGLWFLRQSTFYHTAVWL